MGSVSNYLLFIDESGTHDMANVDPKFPVFALLGLLVGEKYYAKTLVPRVRRLKKAHGLQPDAVLHSRHIRQWEGDFGFLRDPQRRQKFYEDLNQLFRCLRVRLYAVVINKDRFRDHLFIPLNPYNVSLSQLLSLVCGPRWIPGPWRANVARVIAESRGRREDKELQAVYQKFRHDGLSSFGARDVQNRQPSTVARLFPSRVDFVRKSRVVAGLELADLAAYPVGWSEVHQRWDNPSYLVLAEKLKAVVTFP